jgi:type IV pilus assembly protein PilB
VVGKRIGEILVDLGYVTNDRLTQAERLGNGDGTRLGERLCRLGMIREDDIVHALAIQCGIPQVSLPEEAISEVALKTLPADLAQRYRALPMAIIQGKLRMAMANPGQIADGHGQPVRSGRLG